MPCRSAMPLPSIVILVMLFSVWIVGEPKNSRNAFSASDRLLSGMEKPIDDVVPNGAA